MISSSFSTKLNDISQELSMNPRDLLLVMYLESGANPNAVNKSIRDPEYQARGLIQFMPKTLQGMGMSKQDSLTFEQRPAEDQLDFVKKYVQSHRGLIGGKPFTSATQYYVANVWPIALKKWNGDDPVKNSNVVVLDSNNPKEAGAYKANPILDYNKDGKITVGDLTNTLMSMEKSSGFQKMLSQFNRVAGNGEVSEKAKGVSQPQESTQMLAEKNIPPPLMNEINSFLDSFAGKQDSDIIKSSSYLISINSDNDFTSKLEYARILSLALKEELNIQSDIFTNNTDVQIQCAIDTDSKKGELVLKELCSAISDVFSDATKKIGSIKIDTKILLNNKSKYQKLDIKLAETNYRKFHLKFAIGK
jgi:hypothetical protein